jgi:UDP-N-acetylglucosamine acyltransferase
LNCFHAVRETNEARGATNGTTASNEGPTGRIVLDFRHPCHSVFPIRWTRIFTGERSWLRIGNGNYIMTSGHIAHNCIIGNNTVIASCALVAGHVEVEDQAFISDGVVIHQYSRIGRLAMIGGNTRVNLDVPPFFLYSGFNVEAKGLNLVGLKRAGFTHAQIAQLKRAYQTLYRSGLKLDAALAKIETEIPDDNTMHLVRFIRASKRGICRE